MKLSTKASKALQILQNWEDDYNIYNFDSLQNIQGFQTPKLADCCYLMNADEDVKEIINTQFYEIATTGEGGTYALWNYPELQGEPPVVFFGSDGHYSMIAPSLEALAGLFTMNLFLFPEVENDTTPVWQKWRKWHPDLEEIKEDYGFETVEEAKEELLKKIQELKTIMESHFELKTFEDYMWDMNQHKNFRDWYEYVEENNKDTVGVIGDNYKIKTLLRKTKSDIELQNFIDLIDLPITDPKVIKTIENIGIKLPEALPKEEYVIEDYEDELDLKIILNQKENQKKLLFNMIATWKVCKCIYPFGITREDGYEQLVEKIGKPAKYEWKYNSGKTRVWKLINKNGNKYTIEIDLDKNLKGISAFTIESFNSFDTERKEDYIELE